MNRCSIVEKNNHTLEEILIRDAEILSDEALDRFIHWKQDQAALINMELEILTNERVRRNMIE